MLSVPGILQKSSCFLTKQAELGPESKLLEMSDRKQNVSHTRALWWCKLFSPGQKTHSSLHWDCIVFFVECNLTEWKPTWKKPQNIENHKRFHRRNQTTFKVEFSITGYRTWNLIKSLIGHNFNSLSLISLSIFGQKDMTHAEWLPVFPQTGWQRFTKMTFCHVHQLIMYYDKL